VGVGCCQTRKKEKRVVVFVVVVASSGWWAKRRLKKNKNKLQLQQTRTKKQFYWRRTGVLLFSTSTKIWSFQLWKVLKRKKKGLVSREFGFGADFFGTRIISKSPLKELGNVGGGGGGGGGHG